MKGRCSICIPTYNNAATITETLDSCISQDYPSLEIIVSDNNSTDKTPEICRRYAQVKFYENLENLGIGPNIQNLIYLATGSIVVFLCADDIFTNRLIIKDIMARFTNNPKLGYVSRWYFQYMNGYKGAVRVHRSMDPYFQADNPSGLAFRREALEGIKVSTKIFVEGASIVKQVLDKGWDYEIMQYDTIAVRISGGNTAMVSSYYIDSPTLSWLGLIGKNKNLLTAFISLIQLKNWGEYKNVFREIWLFIKLRPVNLLRPDFWLFALIAIFIPRCILRPFTRFYKHRISRIFFDKFKL